MIIKAATDWSQHFHSVEGSKDIRFELIIFAIVALLVIFRLRIPPSRGQDRQPTAAGRLSLGSLFQRDQAADEPADPEQQMPVTAEIAFDPVQPDNEDDARLLQLLETVARNAGLGHRVLARVDIGGILPPRNGSDDRRDKGENRDSMNSERLDFAIIDRSGAIAAAIDHQGPGGYQRDAFLCKAMKKDILQRFGIPLVEVNAKPDSSIIRRSSHLI